MYVRVTEQQWDTLSGIRNSSVSIGTGLQTGQSRVWITVGTREYSLLWNFQTGSGAHWTSYSVGTVVLSLG